MMKGIALSVFAFFCTLLCSGSDGGAQPDSVLIYLHAGGVHSDLILPMENSYCNWRDSIQSPNHDTKVENWLSFGWGSKVFYLNTAAWSQVKMKHLVSGILGIGGAAYHIQSKDEPVISEHCKAIRLSIDEYLALCDFLLKHFRSRIKPAPMIAMKPAKNWDAFYAARGHYWLLNNCNSWSNRALKCCGRSKRKWALTYGHVLKQL
jgi:uncharacterized protein (TIGR02117 family)